MPVAEASLKNEDVLKRGYVPNHLWLYWEHRENKTSLPAHIKLSRATIRHHFPNTDIVVVTPNNITEYLPDLDPRVWDIQLTNKAQNPIGLQSDFVRALVLERHGGFWLDSDCIVLRNLDFIFDYLKTNDFISMRRTSRKRQHISTGFCGSQKNGVVASTWSKKLRRILQEKTLLDWTEAGSRVLTPIVNANLDKVHLFEEHLIHPVVAEKQYLFADLEINIDDVVSPDALMCMLFHKIFEQEIKGVTLRKASIKNLYYGDYLISKVFRRAYPERKFKKKFLT